MQERSPGEPPSGDCYEERSPEDELSESRRACVVAVSATLTTL